MVQLICTVEVVCGTNKIGLGHGSRTDTVYRGNSVVVLTIADTHLHTYGELVK